MNFDPVAATINQLRRDLLRARKDIARLETGAEFTSQFGEDLLAWELLGKPRQGFYVEAGAYDGLRYSVTWALEQLGWTGLLVEPIPEKFQECQINRPRSIVVHAALMDQSGKVDVEVVDNGDLAMLSSVKPTEQPHRKCLVEARRLDDLMPAIRIDLMVLDVEGAEVQALRGFDLKKHRPRLMLIEDNNYRPDNELSKYMQGGEYIEVGRLEVNRIFVRNDQREIFARVRALTA